MTEDSKKKPRLEDIVEDAIIDASKEQQRQPQQEESTSEPDVSFEESEDLGFAEIVVDETIEELEKEFPQFEDAGVYEVEEMEQEEALAEEVMIEEGEVDEELPGIPEAVPEFGRDEWLELVKSLEQEAEEHKDGRIAAGFFAEAGRILERRVGDTILAAEFYGRAVERDSECIEAIEGMRRIHIRRGEYQSALSDIEREREIADEPVIRRRLDCLRNEIELWCARGEQVRDRMYEEVCLGDADPYGDLLGFFHRLGDRQIEEAGGCLENVCEKTTDRMLKCYLLMVCGLGSEIAGDREKAVTFYQEARKVGGEGKDFFIDFSLWRLFAAENKWVEAEQCADVKFPLPDSPLIRGHRFLHAAQLLFISSKAGRALSLLRLLPDSEEAIFLHLLCSAITGEWEGDFLEKLSRSSPIPTPLGSAIWWIQMNRAASIDEVLKLYRDSWVSKDRIHIPEIEILDAIASGRTGEEQLLGELLEKFARSEDSRWVAYHIVMLLFAGGRDEEADKVASLCMQSTGGDELFWLLCLFYLRESATAKWVEHVRLHGSVVEDGTALLGLKIFQADFYEFLLGEKGKADDIRKGILTDGIYSLIPFELVAFKDEEVSASSVIFNRNSISEILEGQKARFFIPSIMALIYSKDDFSPEDRVEILGKILKINQGYLPAFCAMRRELISTGRFSAYFDLLSSFLNIYPEFEEGILGSDRVALAWLSKESFVFEEELKRYFAKLKGDKLAPVHLSLLDGFPAISAEAMQEIASRCEQELSAQRWWFAAGLRWAGRDGGKMLRCMAELKNETLLSMSEGIVELDGYLRGDWTNITERLLGRLRNRQQGSEHGRAERAKEQESLARMAYVDCFLKGELEMGLTEIHSLAQAGGDVPLVELRMLYKELLKRGRRDEVAGVIRTMQNVLGESEELRAYLWVALRLALENRYGEDRIYNEVLSVAKAMEGDVPLMLLKMGYGIDSGELDVLGKIVENLSLVVEGDREKGILFWLLGILLSETDVDSAINFVKEALDRLPTNPAGAFILGRLGLVSRNWALAAMGAKLAGEIFRVPEHKTKQLLQAAKLYIEKVGETGWALGCYEQVLSSEPTNVEAFEGLKNYYIQNQQWDRLCSLVENMLMHIQKEEEIVALRKELADAYARAGRFSDASQIAYLLVSMEPERPEFLSLLADYSVKAGMWKEAVDAYQQMVTLDITDEQKRDIFATLGNIYVEQLPDPHRAAFCFEKVRELGGDVLEVAEKLVDLYGNTGQWEKGIEEAHLLFKNAETPHEKVKWLITMGKFLEEGTGDLKSAEKAYETARGIMPTAHQPVVRLIQLYKKKDDDMALNFLIQRSLGDLRVFQNSSPEDISIYHTAFRILAEAGDSEGARIMGTLLTSFNDLLPDESVVLQKLGGELRWKAGPWVNADEIEEFISPPSMTPSFRFLMQKMADALIRVLPKLHGSYGISRSTRLQKKFPEDEQILEEVTGWFGVKKIQVHLTNLLPNMMAIIPDSPMLLVIGEPLYREATVAQKIYFFSWALKLLKANFYPLLCVGEDELPALWVALIQQFESSFFLSGVSPDDTSRFNLSLSRHFPRKLKEVLYGVALECCSDPNINVATLFTDLHCYADRVALLCSGDIKEVIDLHWKIHLGGEPLTSGAQIQTVLSEGPVVAKLCEFIISGNLAKCLKFSMD